MTRLQERWIEIVKREMSRFDVDPSFEEAIILSINQTMMAAAQIFSSIAREFQLKLLTVEEKDNMSRCFFSVLYHSQIDTEIIALSEEGIETN